MTKETRGRKPEYCHVPSRIKIRIRRNTKYYVDKFEALHYDMDSIITKYFMQDTYPTPVYNSIKSGKQRYVRYCTNRDSFYNWAGLLL